MKCCAEFPHFKSSAAKLVAWVTGNHGNLESKEKSKSTENLESTEKMTLRLVSFS